MMYYCDICLIMMGEPELYGGITWATGSRSSVHYGGPRTHFGQPSPHHRPHENRHKIIRRTWLPNIGITSVYEWENGQLTGQTLVDLQIKFQFYGGLIGGGAEVMGREPGIGKNGDETGVLEKYCQLWPCFTWFYFSRVPSARIWVVDTTGGIMVMSFLPAARPASVWGPKLSSTN